MRKLLSFFLLILSGSLLFFSEAVAVNENNINTDPKDGKTRDSYVNSAFDWNSGYFFGGSKIGEKGAEGLLVAIARDLKNVFIAIAILYMFVLVLRLFFGQGSDDDLKKWRLGLLWTTIGVILMQISFVAFTTVYDKAVGAELGQNLAEKVFAPLIGLLEVSISFLFIAVAIMAFYRIITSGGNDDGYKKGINTIINAVIGFLLVKISTALVKGIYGGEADCTTGLGEHRCTVSTDPNLSDTAKIVASIIQYLTGFVSVITLFLIVYAGFMILTSSGDDAKVKKGKSIIKFIIIGMIIIASSVLIFHFITGKDFAGVIGQYK